MTGYYQFSQALSVAMSESSSAITISAISGVEPPFYIHLHSAPGYAIIYTPALKSTVGSYAMEFCEPRQVREEAAVSEPFRVP